MTTAPTQAGINEFNRADIKRRRTKLIETLDRGLVERMIRDHSFGPDPHLSNLPDLRVRLLVVLERDPEARRDLLRLVATFAALED